MCEMKKYFYFQLETNIEVELLFGKLEFFKISGPEGKKMTVIWDRQVLQGQDMYVFNTDLFLFPQFTQDTKYFPQFGIPSSDVRE